MDIIYNKLAVYGSTDECARTENVFFSPYQRSAMVRFPLSMEIG